MGTSGPIGFEPGMFKKESEEHKLKSDSTNKVYESFHIGEKFLLFMLFLTQTKHS